MNSICISNVQWRKNWNGWHTWKEAGQEYKICCIYLYNLTIGGVKTYFVDHILIRLMCVKSALTCFTRTREGFLRNCYHVHSLSNINIGHFYRTYLEKLRTIWHSKGFSDRPREFSKFLHPKEQISLVCISKSFISVYRKTRSTDVAIFQRKNEGQRP